MASFSMLKVTQCIDAYSTQDKHPHTSTLLVIVKWVVWQKCLFFLCCTTYLVWSQYREIYLDILVGLPDIKYHVFPLSCLFWGIIYQAITSKYMSKVYFSRVAFSCRHQLSTAQWLQIWSFTLFKWPPFFEQRKTFFLAWSQLTQQPVSTTNHLTALDSSL